MRFKLYYNGCFCMLISKYFQFRLIFLFILFIFVVIFYILFSELILAYTVHQSSISLKQRPSECLV